MDELSVMPSDSKNGSRPSAMRRLAERMLSVLRSRREPVLILLVGGVFLLNLVASVLVPFAVNLAVTAPDWERTSADGYSCPSYPDDKVHCPGMMWDILISEYWLDMGQTFGGVYLLQPIFWFAQGQIFWFPWQPFVWLGAAGSLPAVVKYGRSLNKWRLWVYALLISLQLSGFGAYHWSTIGD